MEVLSGGGDHSSNVSFPSTVVLGGVGFTFVHKENDCSHTVCPLCSEDYKDEAEFHNTANI